MGLKIEKDVWVITTEDRKGIVKGLTGDRWLAYVEGINHRNKPIMMYPTHRHAVEALKRLAVRNYTRYRKQDIRIVKMRFTLEEVED